LQSPDVKTPPEGGGYNPRSKDTPHGNGAGKNDALTLMNRFFASSYIFLF
jgi:hypothetical protein